MTKPLPFAALTNLEILELRNVALGSDITPTLATLKKLRHLDISRDVDYDETQMGQALSKLPQLQSLKYGGTERFQQLIKATLSPKVKIHAAYTRIV